MRWSGGKVEQHVLHLSSKSADATSTHIHTHRRMQPCGCPVFHTTQVCGGRQHTVYEHHVHQHDAQDCLCQAWRRGRWCVRAAGADPLRQVCHPHPGPLPRLGLCGAFLISDDGSHRMLCPAAKSISITAMDHQCTAQLPPATDGCKHFELYYSTRCQPVCLYLSGHVSMCVSLSLHVHVPMHVPMHVCLFCAQCRVWASVFFVGLGVKSGCLFAASFCAVQSMSICCL